MWDVWLYLASLFITIDAKVVSVLSAVCHICLVAAENAFCATGVATETYFSGAASARRRNPYTARTSSDE